jgi:DNA-binding LacI/PurR family transcriptional regulator
VAKLANVSSGTVSRALRGLPNVSAETRARVTAAAAQLHYVASPSASSLASGRMSTVGVVTPFISRWFFAEVLNGIEEVLQTARFDLVLYIDGDGSLLQSLPMKRRVDAMILLTLPPEAPDVGNVASMGVPVGSVGVDIEGFSSVKIDDVASAEMAVNHLIGLGHTRIGMVTLGNEYSLPFTNIRDRDRGFIQAMSRAGLEPRPEMIVRGFSSVEGGERAAAQLLSLPERPTALFVQSDEMAMGVLHTIRRAGLRCPEDISVIGFDDHSLSRVFELTTVAQPAHQQGALLARSVLDQVLSGAAPRAEVLATQLVIRGTTAPLA